MKRIMFEASDELGAAIDAALDGDVMHSPVPSPAMVATNARRTTMRRTHEHERTKRWQRFTRNLQNS
jgi:predicted AAA+ superfamily ATPase